MVRTFETHKIRKYQELTGTGWTFTPFDGDKKGQSYAVVTPSCWESYPEFTGYRGAADYSIRVQAKGNLRLVCEGVSHTAHVYWDDDRIVEHYNAYTPFEVVIRDVDNGEHTLRINADNRFSKDSALHIPNDYMTYGGINRPIVLEQIPDCYIRWVRVSTSHTENGWKIQLEVQIENISNHDQQTDIRAEFAEKDYIWEKITIPANKKSTLTQNVLCGAVEEWMPEHPKLYEINTVLYQNGEAVDDLIDRFGFREVTLQNKRICINGKPVRIKGFCRHEDHPQFGCALPLEAMAYDLDLIQDLGANSVRTSHYPNDERFLDLCDERGILVWEENHARGLSLEDMQNPNFEPQAENVIREMIMAHYNHPSIYIWGILNECASETEYGKECYEKQFDLIRSMDQTRPCSFASCKFKTDICFGLPDVVSYNIYPHWYHDTPIKEYLEDLYQWVQDETEGKGKPFLITEIGAGGIYGYRTPYEVKWTEEYQAKTVREQISTVLENQNCCGVYIWQFCDVRVSEEWFHIRPRCMNNKGIVDEYRRRKLSYQAVKDVYTQYGNYA